MNLVSRAVILLCGIYICEAGYGYGDPPPPVPETQSDVQAPAYVPPYARKSQFAKTGHSGYGTKTYSAKTYSGRKTSYAGTKTYSGTKTGGTKTSYGEKQSWHSESGNAPSWEEFQQSANEAYKAKCQPDCQNNGICVDTNTCHCPPNYKGRYCELESKPCLSYPPLPANSRRKCSADFCTINCIDGYKFAGLGTTAANLVCSVDGTWQPTIPLLAAIPDCEPQCNPPCQNAGVCLAVDTCQCPAEFRGPQCQYATSVCDVRKLSFNGGYKCFGDGDSFSCTLNCPAGVAFSSPPADLYTCTYATGIFQPQPIPHCVYTGVAFSSPPADLYTCTYATGVFQPQPIPHCVYTGVAFSSPPADLYTCTYATGIFQPQPIPHCVYSDGVIVRPVHHRNRSYSESFSYHSQSSERTIFGKHYGSKFGQHQSGFGDQQSGFEQQQSGFEQQQSGFEQQQSGFDQQSGIEQEQSNSIEQHQFDTQAGYASFGHSSPLPMQIVVQDRPPTGGVCVTWAGSHYKTFDGKIYSFESPCTHILVRDRLEHKYTVAIRHPECKRRSYCPAELTIYIEDKPYTLKIGENGGMEFSNTRRMIPIPASLTELRVSSNGDIATINLDGLGIAIKWDSNQLVQIDSTVQMWNNTEGLCGTLNGNVDDEFMTKDAVVAPTQSVFEASWQMNKIGDPCSTNPTQSDGCSSKGSEVKKQAQLFCSSVFSKDKFRKCSKVMDVSKLLETCQWDYCACITSESAEDCACATAAVYAKECLRHGVEDMKHWRDPETCPMRCPEGKVYKACGPASQPSCAFPTISSVADNTTCVEGCFCPDEMLLEGNRCLPKKECPCRLRNKAFKPGSVVPKECNTCACEAGEWKCTQAPCGARCSALGDPHYTTFDGSKYDFMGHCTYEMLKTDNLTVEVENVACSGAISEAMNLGPYKGPGLPSCTKAVNVKYNNAEIHLKQGGYILVNGQEISALPVQAGDVRIRAASSLFVIVQLPNKVDVWWDGNTRVYIDVPPEFHEKTKGLCGTFNLNQRDDFLTPEGDIEQSVYAFANKWKTREFCADVDLQIPEHPCKANVENKEAAEKYCSRLKSKLFEECHWYVDVEPYYQDCVYDMCACAGGDVSRCLCPILGDYAMACASQGHRIQWRYNVKECGDYAMACASQGHRIQWRYNVKECGESCGALWSPVEPYYQAATCLGACVRY
ncbi:von willebrand factor type D domain-containing protein [Phthorimaea operculella]|nr:von willebrand factor type D domain-containing protein [Phthorimaea operculella]